MNSVIGFSIRDVFQTWDQDELLGNPSDIGSADFLRIAKNLEVPRNLFDRAVTAVLVKNTTEKTTTAPNKPPSPEATESTETTTATEKVQEENAQEENAQEESVVKFIVVGKSKFDSNWFPVADPDQRNVEIYDVKSDCMTRIKIPSSSSLSKIPEKCVMFVNKDALTEVCVSRLLMKPSFKSDHFYNLDDDNDIKFEEYSEDLAFKTICDGYNIVQLKDIKDVTPKSESICVKGTALTRLDR